jgi:hypothetical protein
MKKENKITGTIEDEVWQQIQRDLTADPDLLSYNATIVQAGHEILFEIDIDPGGGFESGYETTRFILHYRLIPTLDLLFMNNTSLIQSANFSECKTKL